MKISKIVKKIKELDFTGPLIFSFGGTFSVDTNRKEITDTEMQDLLDVFPSKKYNTSIKCSDGTLIIEIEKVPPL